MKHLALDVSLPFLCALFLATTGTSSRAVEIKVVAPIPLQTTLNALVPDFEKSSGHRVMMTYGTSGAVADRVRSGQPADVAVMAAPLVDALAKEGKVESRVDLAKAGIGVFTRRGAPKADVSSVEAFKRALLAAKSIGYVNPALGVQVGIYISNLLERLGMAEELKPKVTLFSVDEAFEHVAKGEVEIGFNLISEIVAAPGVELVGPFPTEIQNSLLYAATIVVGSKEQEGGRTLIRFISSPAAAAILKAKGFDPP
jgi:molybdate transport system substrate-binding protein